MKSAIADRPPSEMYEEDGQIECMCARCGSSVISETCEECEDGYDGHDCGEDCCCCAQPEDNVICQYCRGTGSHHTCCSSREFCLANPLQGREEIERGQIEWFVVKD